jgi:hypothetical protein
MLMTALTIYACFTAATIIWPMIMLAVGIREPGMFTVAAPILIPLLIVAAPFALFFDLSRSLSQRRQSEFAKFVRA